jgi:peptidoglycan hydrolase-like protein with peptidoglycan-binding domain
MSGARVMVDRVARRNLMLARKQEDVMARSFGSSFQPGWLPTLTLAVAMLSTLPMDAAKAQVIERGVQGGVVGAIIGGIVGGGRGAGTGAAMGAGVGIITGAAEADANARAYYDSQYYGAPPPPGGSDLVFNIQTSLVRLGYDPGPPDGLYGQRTADAISQYQHANRLPVDGRPSPQLLNIMISQGG